MLQAWRGVVKQRVVVGKLVWRKRQALLKNGVEALLAHTCRCNMEQREDALALNLEALQEVETLALTHRKQHVDHVARLTEAIMRSKRAHELRCIVTALLGYVIWKRRCSVHVSAVKQRTTIHLLYASFSRWFRCRAWRRKSALLFTSFWHTKNQKQVLCGSNGFLLTYRGIFYKMGFW